MRWSFARNEAEQLRETGEYSSEPAAELHRSSGLAAALSGLREDRPCHVLDLGPAVARSVAFFSSFPCRLRVVDLLGCLAGEPESAARFQAEPDAFLAELMPKEAQPVDLVLAWTVFDHMERSAARHLVSRLAQLTRPGARLYALVSTMHSSRTDGLVFAICDGDTLEYRPAVGPAYRFDAFNPAAVARLLAGFAINHSVVLRHGFQEYVAVRCENAGSAQDSPST